MTKYVIATKGLIVKLGWNWMIFPKELDMVITKAVLLVVWPLTIDLAALRLVTKLTRQNKQNTEDRHPNNNNNEFSLEKRHPNNNNNEK